MQVGPGVEGGFGLRERGSADLGVVPVLGGLEVVLADYVLSDDQDVIGDVDQRRLRYGVGVEAPQLLGAGDVEAPESALDGGPDEVAGERGGGVPGCARAGGVGGADADPGRTVGHERGRGVGAGRAVDSECGVGAGIGCSGAQDGQGQGEPDRADQHIAVVCSTIMTATPGLAALADRAAGTALVEAPGEHARTNGVARRRGPGRDGAGKITAHTRSMRRDGRSRTRQTVTPPTSSENAYLDAGERRWCRPRPPACPARAGRRGR